MTALLIAGLKSTASDYHCHQERIPPDAYLAQEIADDLQTALEQFTAITEKVAG